MAEEGEAGDGVRNTLSRSTVSGDASDIRKAFLKTAVSALGK